MAGDHSTISCVYCEYYIIFTTIFFLGAFHYQGTVFTNANSILTTALLWNYYLHFIWGNWLTERLNNMLNIPLPFYSSVQFSRSLVSDSLWPHELPHARPPSPSPTPGVHPNSCPLIQWCHPAISSSVVPFSSCLQSLPASESFAMSQLFAWGGQKYWSFSFSIIPSKEHPGLISFKMDWLLSES